TVCDGYTRQIDCFDGQHIHVDEASYGRQDTRTCRAIGAGSTSDTDCDASVSVRYVLQQLCNNQKSCSLSANSALFGNPCPGTYKYLQVEYHCHRD
ncbi:hypothetical protein OS493_003465, partial [Desmophyllum pertusum]